MDSQERSISQSQNQGDQAFKEPDDAGHYDDTTEPNFVPRSIFKQAMKSTRFDDPFIEIMYSAKPNRYNSNKFKKLYNDDNLSDKHINDNIAIPLKSKDQNKEKYDDKYYTKIYRNPILNKREKFVVKSRENDAENKNITTKEKARSNELQSSYNAEFNNETKFIQPAPILNPDSNSNANSNPNPNLNTNPNSNSNNDSDSPYSRRNSIPIYKAPILPNPSETNADLRKKSFYTTSYRKSFDNNVVVNDSVNKQMPKPEPISLTDDKSFITVPTYNSKFRPLCGNLHETVVRGGYNKRSDSNDTLPASNWNNQIKSIIFPYKN